MANNKTMNKDFRAFLFLMYSLAKQFISWYEREIKKVI